jgi:hypothetical protein
MKARMTEKRPRGSFYKKRKTTPEVVFRFAACPVCFQVDESSVVDGTRVAVVVLLAVTVLVLAGFIRFARRVARAQQVDP